MKDRIFTTWVHDRGFTVAELLAAMAIFALLAATAIPNLNQLQGQMRSSEEVRQLSHTISEMRMEAIRLRTNVRVNFFDGGYSWDINDDSTTEGSRLFGGNTAWIGSPPSSILFNGLGLARGISGTVTLSISSGGQSLSLDVNKNGHVSI